MHLASLTEQASKVVIEVGLYLQKEFGKVATQQIETKSKNSLVSYVDKTAEQKLVKGLQAILPRASFLTEEATVTPSSSGLRWIIDPLDGTTNFLHQLPCFSISVALYQEIEPLIGIVYHVPDKELYTAYKDGGAFCNKHPIRVSDTPKLQDSLVGTGFPYYDYQRAAPYLDTLRALMVQTRGIRRMGSAAIDLAYLASGKFDVFYEYSLQIWDIAAGILLVREAGGQVSDFKGGADFLKGDVLATNGKLHKDMLDLCQVLN